jgi:hypothetical protein
VLFGGYGWGVECAMPLYAMPCRAGLGEGKQAFGVMDIDVFLFFLPAHFWCGLALLGIVCTEH